MSDDEKDNSEERTSSSSEAAGIVRGLSRSLRSLRDVIRLPGVGSLPRRAAVASKKRLPVQRVASVSDRLSTGVDLLQTAVYETDASSTSWKSRATQFVKSVVKNALLGAAVFETYEHMVTYLAPTDGCNGEQQQQQQQQEEDAYERASIGSHYVAGACGGFVHAIPTTFWESPTASRAFPQLPAMSIHHSIAHSVLFGCYQSMKRALLLDEASDHREIPYFATVTLAGGLAGQIQHVVSHYTEQWLLIGVETTTTPKPYVRFVASPPTLRPILFAFPPSAISFVAFEYGKSILA